MVLSPAMINISALPTQPFVLLNNTLADIPLLLVHVKPNSSAVNRTFTICVPHIHTYSNFKELIEWIELTMLLGVEYFTFYKVSMSKRMEQTLSYYSKRGLVEVLPWQMPKDLSKDMHYHGQLADINDCLYRNRNSTKYLAFNDLDEYIIPRGKDTTTWADMMPNLKPRDSFSFRGTFFWREWAAKPTTSEDDYTDNLLTMSVLKHANRTFNNGVRSKLMICPEKVEMMKIHDVGEMVSGENEISNGVDINIGLLHHYRSRGGYEQIVEGPVEDNTMLKYRNALIERVKTFWKNFKNE